MGGAAAWRRLISNLSRQSSKVSLFRLTIREDPLHFRGSNTESGDGGEKTLLFKTSVTVQAAQFPPWYSNNVNYFSGCDFYLTWSSVKHGYVK